MEGNWDELLIVNVIRLVSVVMVIVILVLDIILCIVVGIFKWCFWWFNWLIMMNMLLRLMLMIRKGRIFIIFMKGVCINIVIENLVKILRFMEKVLLKVSRECLVNGFWKSFLIIKLVNCNMIVNVRVKKWMLDELFVEMVLFRFFLVEM